MLLYFRGMEHQLFLHCFCLKTFCLLQLRLCLSKLGLIWTSPRIWCCSVELNAPEILIWERFSLFLPSSSKKVWARSVTRCWCNEIPHQYCNGGVLFQFSAAFSHRISLEKGGKCYQRDQTKHSIGWTTSKEMSGMKTKHIITNTESTCVHVLYSSFKWVNAPKCNICYIKPVFLSM